MARLVIAYADGIRSCAHSEFCPLRFSPTSSDVRLLHVASHTLRGHACRAQATEGPGDHESNSQEAGPRFVENRDPKLPSETQGSSEAQTALLPALRSLQSSLLRLSSAVNEVAQDASALADAIESLSDLSSVQGDVAKVQGLISQALSGPQAASAAITQQDQELLQLQLRLQSLEPLQDTQEQETSLRDAPTDAVLSPEELWKAEEVEGVHGTAVQLQRAFVQARVEGLGKPSQEAMEDFVDVCMAARADGVALAGLQLKLILAEGSLPAQFSTASSLSEPAVAEEATVRNSWVRLVYVTLEAADRLRLGMDLDEDEFMLSDDASPSDPMDSFVLQTVRAAVEQGQDLDVVRLEQTLSDGPSAASPAIRMMRQSQLLILTALHKAQQRAS